MAETVPSTPWRSRGYLPHIDLPGLVQSITFRLADSLPQEFLVRCAQELAALPESKRLQATARRLETWLDRGSGACHLRDPHLADLVERTLLHFDDERYRLIAWCIMPNHVHVVIESHTDHPMARVVHSWKSFTASRANRYLGLRGRFWHREYHDRFVRDNEHMANVVRYVEGNAVKAGLVEVAEDWRWCSAWRRFAHAGRATSI